MKEYYIFYTDTSNDEYKVAIINAKTKEKAKNIFYNNKLPSNFVNLIGIVYSRDIVEN